MLKKSCLLLNKNIVLCPLSCRDQAETKNARKNPCLLAPWPSAEVIFLRRVNMNLIRRGEGLTHLNFQRDDQKKIKGVGGP
jgi:hypothetical protein